MTAAAKTEGRPLSRGDRNAEMLSILAEMGLPASIVSMLLEFGGVELSPDDARFLRGPIIYHQGRGRWGETIPEWMFDQVRAERTEIALGRLKMPVGPTEIAVVMYPATMEAPLYPDVAELYLWASTHAAARHYGKPVDEYWKSLNHPPIRDDEVIKPGGRLYKAYRTLAAEIRTKVVRVQTERERNEKRPAEAEVQRPAVQRKVPLKVQKPKEQPPPTKPPEAKPQRKPAPAGPEPGLFSWLLKAFIR